MSLTIIFITLIVCTVVIVLTILVKSSDQKDKSEIESTALGQGVGEALESIEQRLNDKKRQINILDSGFLKAFIFEFEQLINGE